VSDRALRYRTQTPECKPAGPRICAFCGSTSNVEIHHVDGFEEHGERENLAWCCRRCNTKIGAVMARHGLGRRTKQYNPPTSTGARSLGQWVTAVLSMKGEGPMEPAAAVEMIRATPPERRSDFARQIWERRRQHGTDRLVPF